VGHLALKVQVLDWSKERNVRGRSPGPLLGPLENPDGTTELGKIDIPKLTLSLVAWYPGPTISIMRSTLECSGLPLSRSLKQSATGVCELPEMGDCSSSQLVPLSWWRLDVPDGCSVGLPGIYEWRIGDESLYIGKSVRLASRLREYPNNVRKIIEGSPYRKSNPDGYREVHRELNRARATGMDVSVTVLENCERQHINERERYWIAARVREAAKGGPRVLNAQGGDRKMARLM